MENKCPDCSTGVMELQSPEDAKDVVEYWDGQYWSCNICNSSYGYFSNFHQVEVLDAMS